MKNLILPICLLLVHSVVYAQSSAKKEFPVAVKEIDEFTVVYYEFTGPYDKSFGNFYDLIGFLQSEGVEMGNYSLGIFYDDPQLTAPEKCRSEIGMMVNNCSVEHETYKCKTIKGGKAVVCNYKSMEDIMDAYATVSAYIEKNDIKTSPYSIEIYKSNDPNVVDADIVFFIK